jgi:hypothetical protein
MINWKGCGRNLSWLNFKILSCHRLEGQRKTTKNFSQNRRYSGQISPVWGNTSSVVQMICSLGGAVVSVLATGPNGRWFEPGQGEGFLRAIKIRMTSSFGWEVKPEIPCRKILLHVKSLSKSHGDGETKFPFPSSVLLLAPEMSLLTGPLDSTGGCQSALVDKFGVSHSRYHHTMVHIAITRGWTIGRSSETSVLLHHNQSTKTYGLEMRLHLCSNTVFWIAFQVSGIPVPFVASFPELEIFPKSTSNKQYDCTGNQTIIMYLPTKEKKPKTRTNICAPSRIQTCGPNIQATKAVCTV